MRELATWGLQPVACCPLEIMCVSGVPICTQRFICDGHSDLLSLQS